MLLTMAAMEVSSVGVLSGWAAEEDDSGFGGMLRTNQ